MPPVRPIGLWVKTAQRNFTPDLIWRGFKFRSRPNGTGTILTAGDAAFGCGRDSAVGGALLQTRGESLVFGETEGEFRRERDPGCSSENRVSIFARISNFTATECHAGAVAPRRVLGLHTATWTLQTLIFFCCVPGATRASHRWESCLR